MVLDTERPLGYCDVVAEIEGIETMTITTNRPTVILPEGARHIDSGDHTACGFPIVEGSAHDPAMPDTRISCGFCGSDTTHPRFS